MSGRGPRIKTIDAVLLRWIGIRHPGREGDLVRGLAEALSDHASERLGWYLTSDRLRDVLGDVDGAVDHVQVDGRGTLCSMIMMDEEADGLHWERGILSLWRSRYPLPDTLVMALPGLRLDQVVRHRMLEGSMVIASVDATDMWTRLMLEDWTRPASEFGIG